MAFKGTILALDIATSTGWAYGRPGETPRYGSQSWAAKAGETAADDGTVGAAATRWLHSFMTIDKPDLLIYEAPLGAGGRSSKGSSERTTRRLLGLTFLIETVGVLKGVPSSMICEANVQTVRKHFVGQARPADGKAAVMARCRQLGWAPRTHDEGDALALWDFAGAVMVPGLGARLAVERMVARGG